MISRTRSGNAAAIALFILFGLMGRVLADGQACDLNRKGGYAAGIGGTALNMETVAGHMCWIRD